MLSVESLMKRDPAATKLSEVATRPSAFSRRETSFEAVAGGLERLIERSRYHAASRRPAHFCGATARRW